MGRRDDRREYALETRTGLLESDLDHHDREHQGIRDELKGMRTVLIGILGSTATASILLAVNIALGGVK